MNTRRASRYRLAALALAGAALAAAAQSGGFRYINVQRLGLRLPLPDGWHYVNNQAKLQPSFAAVRTLPPPGQPAPVGLSVFAVDRLAGATGRSLARRIDDYARRSATQAGLTLELERPARHGRLVGRALRFVDRSASGARRVHRLYLADAAADRLLIVSFEAPLSEWDRYWPTARVMLAGLLDSAGPHR